MGVVIGKMDGQVEKIFLGNNLTRSTRFQWLWHIITVVHI